MYSHYNMSVSYFLSQRFPQNVYTLVLRNMYRNTKKLSIRCIYLKLFFRFLLLLVYSDYYCTWQMIKWFWVRNQLLHLYQNIIILYKYVFTNRKEMCFEYLNRLVVFNCSCFNRNSLWIEDDWKKKKKSLFAFVYKSWTVVEQNNNSKISINSDKLYMFYRKLCTVIPISI